MGHRADVTLHIDEDLDNVRTDQVCDALKATDGIVNVRCAEHKAHLYVVEFDPDRIGTHQVLDQVQRQGLHAQLIGL